VSTTPARSRRRLWQYLLLVALVVVGLVLLAREEDMWAWGAFGAAAGGVITVAQSRRRENRD
jgi:preprotein translocase subunit SecG